ncbi:MAG: hypothetical protein E7057_10870 [Lentisphaerae bacterium]|nr:hypothetical protein [Lentisphaerota bacterium]
MKRSISALLFFSSIALAAIDFTPFAKTPASEPASTAGMRISNPKIKALWLSGPDYQGKPTKVFAWYGLPEHKKGEKVPAVVLLHGSGGTAFSDWVALWNGRGYAAIAIDYHGRVPARQGWSRNTASKESPYAGPAEKFWFHADVKDADNFNFHSVAAVMSANSFLRSQPEIDQNNIGIIGVSMGGILTARSAGIDGRFRFAVPVYGSGNVISGSYFRNRIRQLGKAVTDRYTAEFDPAVSLKNTKLPMLFVKGADDGIFYSEGWFQSTELPQGEVFRSLRLNLKHGHEDSDVPEIRLFADYMTGKISELPRFGKIAQTGSDAAIDLEMQKFSDQAVVMFHCSSGPIDRKGEKWSSVNTEKSGNRYSARIPAGMKYGYFSVRFAGYHFSSGLLKIDASAVKAAPAAPVKSAAAVIPGARRASEWGFNAVDSTAILQKAIYSKVSKLIIDKQSSPWITGPLKFVPNQEIIFEEGAEIIAVKGGLKELRVSLLNIENADNVTIRGLGKGGIIRMHKKDYQDKKQYQSGEWRHAVNVKNSNNFRLENMNIYSSGGDGVYLCLVKDAVVRNVLCEDHHRQGLSIIGGKNILVENSAFNRTKGTSPQSGIDIEPNNTNEPLQGIVIRNCRFEENFRWGILVAATRANSDLAGEMDIRFENCIAKNNREGDIYAYTRTEFKTGDPVRGKIDFLNCQAVATRNEPFYRPPVEVDVDLHHQLNVNFDNLVITRAKNPSKAIQVNFNHPLSENSTPQSKITFNNTKLTDVSAKDALQINDYSFSGKSDWISGEITDSTGKKTVLDDAFLKACGYKQQPEYSYDFSDRKFSAAFPADGQMETLPEFSQILSADYWLLAKSGKKVDFKLKYTKNGRWSREPAKVTLVAPDGSRSELGDIAPASEKVFSFTAAADGIHRVEVRGFYLKTAIIGANVPAGPIAKEFENELDRVTGTLYFHVPPRTPEFAIRVWGRGFVNSVGVTITDPNGKIVYRNPAVAGSGFQFNADKENAAKSGVWKITFAKPRRFWYDRCFFRMMGVSPYLGLKADRTPTAE